MIGHMAAVQRAKIGPVYPDPQLTEALAQEERGEGVVVTPEELAAMRQELQELIASGKPGLPPTLEAISRRAGLVEDTQPRGG